MRKKHHPPKTPPAADPMAAEGDDTGAAAVAEAPAPEVPVAEPGVAAEPQGAAAPAAEAVAKAPVEAEAPPAASAAEALARLERDLAEQKDRLLRTAADFDNFRKRAAKEKTESWARAQADLVQRLLDVVDDLGRVAHLDPAQTSAQALHEGMGLVEKKLLKAFETVGVERIDPSGSAFDPNAHEAVMTVPAPGADQDGQVASVFQAGYRMGGALLRPARVAVHVWTEPVVPEGAN